MPGMGRPPQWMRSIYALGVSLLLWQITALFNAWAPCLQECEVNAEFVARTINVPERQRTHAGVAPASRAAVVADLERLQGCHPVLKKTMAKGVVFHHAGDYHTETSTIAYLPGYWAVGFLPCYWAVSNSDV